MIAEEQVQRTYRQLRVAAGMTLIVVPILIVLAGWFDSHGFMPTLSHYYFYERHPGIIRTMFTGFLVLVGGIMIAYRGFDDRDNRVHNFAGLAAMLVAAFPKKCDPDDRFYTDGLPWIVHGPSAVLLFLLAAYAVFYAGGATLQDNLDATERRMLQASRWASLATMAAGIGIYVAFLVFDGIVLLPNVGVLIVELLGFFGFAWHWLMMTIVIEKANTRRAAGHEKSAAPTTDRAVDAAVRAKSGAPAVRPASKAGAAYIP